MTGYSALREKPRLSAYKKDDVLVLFGELFSRGYANGLVEEAENRGMRVIYATVGRREKDGSLRPLNSEEAGAATQPLINIPLEAGFDYEPPDSGLTPVEQLKEIKLQNWNEAKLDFAAIESSRKKGVSRFKKNVQAYLNELADHIKPGQNVLFAHLMAGGVPRAKIVMPLMNRVFKGTGDRHLPSERFWDSDIGKLCATSFLEVTAETFQHLLVLSEPMRKRIEAANGHVSYVAYGYHGTEVLHDDEYKWQTYTPYLQGWAKMRLEEISRDFYKSGIHCCVYNCPEILTNSSSIFQGVEVCLSPLLQAMKKETPQAKKTAEVFEKCQSLLQEGISLEQIFKKASEYSSQSLVKEFANFDRWPQHSRKDQMELMLSFSDELASLHKDSKNLITAILSEVVFESCGYVMLHDSWEPKSPVSWINHDLVAQCLK